MSKRTSKSIFELSSAVAFTRGFGQGEIVDAQRRLRFLPSFATAA